MNETELIDAVLFAKKMSRRQLAKQSKIPVSSLQSALERGKNISLDMLNKISNTLDLPISFFTFSSPFNDFELLDSFRGVILYSLQKHGILNNRVLAELDDYTYYKAIADNILSIVKNEDSTIQITYKETGAETEKYVESKCSINLTPYHVDLINKSNKLNNLGKKKALERVEELAKIPDYQRKDTDE